MQQTSHSTDRAEIFCVLFDTVDSDGSGVISRDQLETCIMQLSADVIRNQLIREQTSDESPQAGISEDFGARVVMGTPMGRLHIICRCLGEAVDAGMLRGRASQFGAKPVVVEPCRWHV